MKINVKCRIDDSKGISDFNVIIEGKYKDELEDLKKYIENYKGKIIVLDNNIIKSIDYNDILYFFSDKKIIIVKLETKYIK